MSSRQRHLPFLRAIALFGLVALGLPALADEQCGAPDALGNRQCQAGLASDSVATIAAVQEQPQWCWAASISMIFAHHGYRVRQEEIVKDGYGVAVNLPASSGQVMTNALSKAWTDQNARGFQSTAQTSDALARHYEVSNGKVIAELTAGRPLLVGTSLGHAMVLVNLKYQRMVSGAVRINGGTVIDPDPSRGVRPMASVEMKLTYVAAVQVMAADQRVASLDLNTSR
jgi:hypothetical protein